MTMLDDTAQRRRLLARVAVFGPMDEAAFAVLESHAEWVGIRRGEVLIRAL